jgi:hypothetical protein
MTLWFTVKKPVVNVTVPEIEKLIVSPSFASASAWRNEPGPLSFALVTVMVFAVCKEKTTATAAAELKSIAAITARMT